MGRARAGEDELQITAAVALDPTEHGESRALIGFGQPLSRVAPADINRARLTIPPGYREVHWPEARSR